MNQSRKWLITINNPKSKGLNHEVIIDKLSSLSTIDYFCMVDEIGGETKTYHTHVFIYSQSPIRFNSISKRFPLAHIDNARGTCEENRTYLLKEGKWTETDKISTTVEGTFYEFGEMPVDKNHEEHGETMAIIDELKNGDTEFEVLMRHLKCAYKIRNITDLKRVINQQHLSKIRDVDVIFIYDPNGIYDCNLIYQEYGIEKVCRITSYRYPMKFDNYSGEAVMVLYNYKCNLPLEELIVLCEGFPLYLNARYENKIAAYTTLIIHSNIDIPEYKKCGSNQQYRKFRSLLRKYINAEKGEYIT